MWFGILLVICGVAYLALSLFRGRIFFPVTTPRGLRRETAFLFHRDSNPVVFWTAWCSVAVAVACIALFLVLAATGQGA